MTDSLSDMIACPKCDALHRVPLLDKGAEAKCVRCGTVLMAPRDGAMTRIVMLSLTALILMIAAVFFPFLKLSVQGLGRESSVFDAILSFSDGLMLPLSFAVAALIVVLPMMRFIALIYVFAPMALGWAPARHAKAVYKLAETVRPWAMAEIFIIGVAVALVKVAGLAQVTLGPAFWAFVGLVIVTVLKDNFMCRVTVWQTLNTRSPS
ncbi:paraquat-inducible protein A [Marivita sp. XM-24bin2]|uniref:paraquat-inducible protein A n=1 Tax=unclassified Marivita TaxID=2632480 RepID=UPI0025BBD7E1|nr:paraquat-inducible protein A [Marivita sp. XM-24bin2]MCR9108802.1 paraquat-inducible protein A [Paracoccaceae bacterium]